MKACWIQTFSGRRFEPMNPDPMSICIEDVAHALGNACRFTGHTRKFYSVAQHSVLVSEAVAELEEVTAETQLQLARAGLLHDASEAYLVDVPSPIKPHIHGYAEIERKVMNAVSRRFCVPVEHLEHPLVKRADRLLLATEARDLINKGELWSDLLEPLPGRIVPLPPAEAKALFMRRFRELFR